MLSHEQRLSNKYISKLNQIMVMVFPVDVIAVELIERVKTHLFQKWRRTHC